MPPSAPETRRPAACYPQRICGILATENRCPTRPLRGADQARAAIQAALAQIGICLPGTITIRPARRGKDPLNLRGQPAVPARPLHPVDPHRQRQDRHPAAHPAQYQAYAPRFGNARRLRALTAELQALSLEEMARAEGWATITPARRPAPHQARPVPNHPKRREISPLNPGTAHRQRHV